MVKELTPASAETVTLEEPEEGPEQIVPDATPVPFDVESLRSLVRGILEIDPKAIAGRSLMVEQHIQALKEKNSGGRK